MRFNVQFEVMRSLYECTKGRNQEGPVQQPGRPLPGIWSCFQEGLGFLTSVFERLQLPWKLGRKNIKPLRRFQKEKNLARCEG